MTIGSTVTKAEFIKLAPYGLTLKSVYNNDVVGYHKPSTRSRTSTHRNVIPGYCFLNRIETWYETPNSNEKYYVHIQDSWQYIETRFVVLTLPKVKRLTRKL